MSAYCMSNLIWKGLGLLKNDKKQIQSSYVVYVIIIIFENKSFQLHRGSLVVSYIEYVSCASDSTKELRSMSIWRNNVITGKQWRRGNLGHVYPAPKEMQSREK